MESMENEKEWDKETSGVENKCGKDKERESIANGKLVMKNRVEMSD